MLNTLLRLTPLLCLLGCSFILDDPQPFKAQDKPEELDAAFEDLPLRPDIPPLEGGVSGCIPEEEVCDGADNDCDREIDEDFTGRCEPCLVEGGQGRCAVGKLICFGGQLHCAPWRPEPGPTTPCDLIDNDCDGLVDEDSEIVFVRTRPQQQMVDECGDAPIQAWAPPTEGDCDEGDPRRVGCAPTHPCYEFVCREGAYAARRDAEAACLTRCQGDDPTAEGVCVLECRERAFNDFIDALVECPTPEGASRWSCTNDAAGARCEAVDCAEGTEPDGPACLPPP